MNSDGAFQQTANLVAFELRIVGMLTGWEATIVLLGLQAMADWLTPTELESWCSRYAFGTGQETTLRITDHSVAR